MTWVGLQNYVDLFDDDSFYTSLKNNVIWLDLYLLAIPAGLAVALFLNQTVAGIRLYKSLFFFRSSSARWSSGSSSHGFYAPISGLLPKIISAFTGTEVAVLADEHLATMASSPPASAADRLLHDPLSHRPQQHQSGAGRGGANWTMPRLVDALAYHHPAAPPRHLQSLLS